MEPAPGCQQGAGSERGLGYRFGEDVRQRDGPVLGQARRAQPARRVSSDHRSLGSASARQLRPGTSPWHHGKPDAGKAGCIPLPPAEAAGRPGIHARLDGDRRARVFRSLLLAAVGGSLPHQRDRGSGVSHRGGCLRSSLSTNRQPVCTLGTVAPHPGHRLAHECTAPDAFVRADRPAGLVAGLLPRDRGIHEGIGHLVGQGIRRAGGTLQGAAVLSRGQWPGGRSGRSRRAVDRG